MISERDIIYLDNNATTRPAPEVLEAMQPWMGEFWGNASSGYRFGKQSAQAIDKARGQVAALLNCEPEEIIFTSCATESNNAALLSAIETTGKRHIVTSAVEHPSVHNPLLWLERKGCKVTFLPVNPDGTLAPRLVEAAITDETALVSVMWANNETGVLLPALEIANICAAKGVLFHSDAVPIAGKLPLDLKDAPINFLSLSMHKLHAPRGVGVLFIRKHTRFAPLLRGGNQELEKRAGTENTAAIVAAGAAAELAQKRLNDQISQVRPLRDRLENFILKNIAGTSRNGHPEKRLPNTSNITFRGIDAPSLLVLLNQKNICVSTGSACTTGKTEPSRILTAMGLSAADARASIRFSLSHCTTEKEIETVERELPQMVKKLRDANPIASEIAG